MSGTTRVLVAAHDAGGARALIPVVEVLRARGAVVLAVVAGPAASLWAAECPYVAAEEVSDDVTVASAAERLDAARTELLLTACGLYNRMEHTFRLAASGRRIRTVAVLDSWLNYRERFERTSAAGLVRCIPHVVCVMDGTSRRDLEAAGLAAERVVVTGPPNLEASVTVARSVTPEQRVAWRHEAGIAVDDLAMVFFSEPFVIGPGGAHFEGPGALIRPDGGSFYGYTAVDTLTAVLDELHGAHRAPGGRVRVIVKPHPAEWAEPLRAIARKRSERSVHVIVRDDGPAVQWISVADVAVGMMSIALLEAALAGVPALSVQLGLRESGADDPCLAARLGWARGIYDRAALSDAVGRLVRQGPRTLSPTHPEPLWIDGAAERVARIVLGEACRRGGR